MVQKNSIRQDIIKEKQKLLIIAGPTAVGKSSFAVEIAKKFNGEIVGADSMQIYRFMNIGTGKINDKDMQGIKHYLIDIKNPDENYSVSEFTKDAKKIITAISADKKLPILCGGTGLYINSLLSGYNFAQAPKSEEIRKELNLQIEKRGLEFLYRELQKIDAETALKISSNDSKRIIRALEIYHSTGKTKSKSIISSESEYDYLFIILNKEREKLYSTINERVDEMFSNGLESEVKSLQKFRNCQSMQAIGYKEFNEYFDGNQNIDEVIYTIKQNSRHYAKRQLTYFKWMKPEKYWYEIENKAEIEQKINCFLNYV